MRLRRALGDEFRHGEVVAGRRKVGIVVGGEHGDGEDAQRSLPRFDGGLHGLRIGMNGQESGAEPGHAFDALPHRVADVVELEIEKDPLAGASKCLRVFKPAGKSELIADLVERHGVAEPRHHGPRRLDRGQIKRDDQALARLHQHGYPLHAVRRGIISAISTSRCASVFNAAARRFILEIVALVERLVRTRHRDLFRNHQRAAAEFENLPQRHERTKAAGGAGRGRADGEYAALEGGVSRLAGIAHARDPVDGVLQERRHRGAVFGAGDEHALMRLQHAPQLHRMVRHDRGRQSRRRTAAADNRRARCGSHRPRRTPTPWRRARRAAHYASRSATSRP